MTWITCCRCLSVLQVDNVDARVSDRRCVESYRPRFKKCLAPLLKLILHSGLGFQTRYLLYNFQDLLAVLCYLSEQCFLTFSWHKIYFFFFMFPTIEARSRIDYKLNIDFHLVCHHYSKLILHDSKSFIFSFLDENSSALISFEFLIMLLF